MLDCMNTLSYFAALPPYLGGKRGLAPLIFASLAEALPRREWLGRTFLDPMVGGGAVALMAKVYGFGVIAGDVSGIGQVVARALIANPSVRLTPAHLLALASAKATTDVAAEFVPAAFTRDQAAWIDRVASACLQFADPVRALGQLVLIHTALGFQPGSMLDATDAKHRASGDYDRISSRRLGHYLRADRRMDLAALERVARAVNAGVIGGQGRALSGDALDVIPATPADVIYLDPPYPSTTGYRHPYAPLRAVLSDPMTESAPSLDQLLEAAKRIETAVISYGGPGVTLDALIATVARHRRVVSAVAVPYPHLRSLAREETARGNREFIVIAQR
jgi:D12 class N6 adenine-specific DNA methyltransferase